MNDELSDFSFSDSLSISRASYKEQYNNIINTRQLDDITFKDFPLRCPECWNICRFYADFNKDYFESLCDNHHKNEYASFDSFLEKCFRDLSSILCNICKKSVDDYSKMNRCNICNLFICSECLIKHKQEKNHLDYIELNKIDNYCPKHKEPFKYYDFENKSNICEKCYINKKEDINKIKETSKIANYQKTINDFINKVNENIKILKTLLNLTNEWLKNLINKFDSLYNYINDYLLLQQKIVKFLNIENNIQKYQNNYNVYYNYEITNNDNIDKFIKHLNNKLNNNYKKDDDIQNMTKFFLDLIQIKDLNIEKKNNLKTVQGLTLYSESLKKKNNLNKIENMDKKKYEFDINVKVKCLSSFDENKLIIGLSSSEINILEEKKGNDSEKYLELVKSIKEFKNEVNNICELDKDMFIASDIENNVKIFQVEPNMKNYKIIQDLKLKENIGNIHTIIKLPIFSYYKNKHYFCIGGDNNILIYKSNKMPKNLKPPAINYHDKPEQFSIVQPEFKLGDDNSKNEALTFIIDKDIESNSIASCLVEVNEAYLFAGFSKDKNIKAFGMHNEFKEVINYPEIALCEGNCTISVSKDRTKIIAGCIGSICIINIDNLKKINKLVLNQNILCLDIYENDCFFCASLKRQDIFVKQYKLNENYKKTSKISESRIYSAQNIIFIKVIKNKIFYLDDSNFIHYYLLENNNN